MKNYAACTLILFIFGCSDAPNEFSYICKSNEVYMDRYAYYLTINTLLEEMKLGYISEEGQISGLRMPYKENYTNEKYRIYADFHDPDIPSIKNRLSFNKLNGELVNIINDDSQFNYTYSCKKTNSLTDAY